MKKSTLYGVIISALLLAFGGIAGRRLGLLASGGAAISATVALLATVPWRRGKYRVVGVAHPGAPIRYRLEPARKDEATRTTEGPQFNVYVYVFDDYRSAKAFLKSCRAGRE